nr:methyltransferase domain-containing protein [Candidatus Woesearchaeota archaeon]
MKILLRENSKLFWKSGDLHTQSGVIKEKDLKKNTSMVKTHSGKEFMVFPASFLDKIERIKRSPQAITEKDIASIILYSNISQNSKVLESGTGSGKLTSFLARIVFPGKLISYDINKENLKLSKQNFEFLELNNIILKNKDIYQGIQEKNLDAVILDLPESYKVLKHASKALKHGGFLVVFSIHVSQVKKLLEDAKDFVHIITLENIQREWLIDERRSRPNSQHLFTGFITILRNIKR